MNKIEVYLNLASRAYYAGEPFISDEVFDYLADLIGYNKVGAKQHEHLGAHFHRMYSLQKYYEDEGVKPLENIATNDKVNSLKLDGAAISLLYLNGELAQVLTRGDGVEGTIITDKFLATNLVPLKLEGDVPPVLQVTGEIVAPKHIENARNYAAGSLNLKDLEEFKTRAISFFAYSVYPYFTDTYTKDMGILSGLGFSTVFAEGLIHIYDTDGIVVRVDNNDTFQYLGYTTKAPRGAYAIKVRGEAVETTLLNVEWAVGRTGKVTPTAILEPVYIGDKLVSRATLNNPAFIEMLGLAIGDTVGVIMGGEIIPCITHKVEA